MTIDDISQKSFDGQEIKTEAEAFCRREQIAPAVFLDQFARHIVTGYLDGRFTWLSCDTAMNILMGLMSTVYLEFPDFAYGVFLAFDAAEYHPETPALTPDQVTRPLIDGLLTKHRAA
jgi:hypothetical protein